MGIFGWDKKVEQPKAETIKETIAEKPQEQKMENKETGQIKLGELPNINREKGFLYFVRFAESGLQVYKVPMSHGRKPKQ